MKFKDVFDEISVSIKSELSNKILNESRNDELYRDICEYLDNKNLPIPHPKINKFSLRNSFLFFNNKFYISPNYRTYVLSICHDSPSSHFGIKKTFNILNRNFWWPSSNLDIKNYVRSCEICCCSKTLI